MIRINLLPAAKRTAVASGSTQLWGVAFMVGLFVWGGLIAAQFVEDRLRAVTASRFVRRKGE